MSSAIDQATAVNEALETIETVEGALSDLEDVLTRLDIDEDTFAAAKDADQALFEVKEHLREQYDVEEFTEPVSDDEAARLMQ